MDVETMRKKFQETDDERDSGLVTPSTIERFDDLVYGDDEQIQVLDVYRPKDMIGKLPVIVSVHGGGFVYGDKERYQYYCMDIALRGFAVVNFTYHLAPEYKFPQPLIDTNLVIKWIYENYQKYDLDIDNIFMVGDSAGATILSQYAAICTNSTYADQFDFEVPNNFVPKAIGLNCGIYDFNNGDGILSYYLENQGSDTERKLMSSIDHVTEAYPPVFIMSAYKDFLRKELPGMATKLFELKIPFIARLYGDENNQLNHVFHLRIRLKDAKDCNDEQCNFFKTYIKKMIKGH